MTSRRTLTNLFLILCVFGSLRLETEAQIRPVYDQGALGLAQLLKRLNTTASALMIGAHPDDEDTALLAYLARGESARTAYLSLTRGDGGQNIIGPELGEALGVIRTEELLQARKLDGAEQYFARAYDYGFSKTLEEAKQKWNEQAILCDVVRVIRNVRPLVVISQFTGTASDGHGQHQFAGYIAPIAVEAAADQARCSGAGPRWQVKKFYVRHRGSGEPTIRINTGQYDPLLGRSYFEIAMHARSQHRSQEQGVLELKGDQFSALNQIGGGGVHTEIFADIDTSIASVGQLVGNSENRFSDAARRLSDTTTAAVSAYKLGDQTALLRKLVEGYKLAYDAEWITRDPGSKAVMHQKQLQFLDAIKLAAGIQIDSISDKETVAAGEEFTASNRVFFPLSEVVRVKEVAIKTPVGWSVEAIEPPADTRPPSQFVRRESSKHFALFRVMAPKDAKPTEPYWLSEPRDGDMFRWQNDSNQTLPFQPPVLSAEIKLDIHGVELVFSQPVEYRYADDVRGEVRRELNVVPTISIDLDKALLIVPSSEQSQRRRLQMSVTNHSSKEVSGTAYLAPESRAGWSVDPRSERFDLKSPGDRLSFAFDLTIPPRTRPESYLISAVANMKGSLVASSMVPISYPHIQTHRYYRKTLADVKILDLKTETVRVGYVKGSGDRVFDAIAQLGLNVEEIDERTLATGDLSKFDTIVVGIRAYQVRPDVVANNQKLLDFAKNGGTLIVQYQLPATYAQRNLTPYPTQMGPRVVDENATVTIVEPTHPIFNSPNKITGEDFKGWVQERNLYNFSTMDSKYIGLLESHDAGEAENKGGLVVADIGKGKYVYCSYSLFRQLPAGVPGAYRLLANLVSLPRAGQSAAKK